MLLEEDVAFGEKILYFLEAVVLWDRGIRLVNAR
jgi:hypothetical protein